MPLIKLSKLEDVKSHINQNGSCVVMMASATYCMPCKMFTPVLEEVSNEFSGKVSFIKVNMDESPDVNSLIGVGSVPTIIYWKNTKEIHRDIGGCPKEQLITKIKNLFDL